MRRVRTALFASLPLLALAACRPASAAIPPAATRPERAAVPPNNDTLRVDGEYGLFVTRDADTVRVAWLTRTRSAGVLQVLAGGGVRHDLTTPPDTAHAVSFTHRGGGSVTLRYGARDDAGDRHETVLRLDRYRRPRVSWTGVDSVFVMGDIHGEFDTLTAVLRNARVIDERNRWSGGRAHLVIVGDMMDRGRDVNRVLWFLYGLEPQAEAAGGRLDIVLGNHEVMVMVDDLRYVHPKELAIAQAHGITYDRMFDPRRSILGSWLASKPALIRIDDVLLAHGGVSGDFLRHTLESVDDTLQTYIGEELFYRWADTTYVVPLDSASLARRNDFFWGDRSIFWYRGYAQSDTLTAELTNVLQRFRSRVHVVGHTPARSIRQGYDGRLIAVNTAPFAAELLLLVRQRDGYQRLRFRTSGPPEPL